MSEAAVAVAQPDVSKYMYQIRKLKDALKLLTDERDKSRSEVTRLLSENTELKTKGDSSALAKRNQELEGKLRVIEHRKVLDKAALAKGIKPEALDAFFKLSEYDAKDEPNEEEIGAFVASKVESLSFLVGKAEPETPEAAAKKLAVGSGKSGSTATTTNGFDLPPKGDRRWSDPKWLAKTQDQRAARAKDNEAKGVVEDFA
jgi:hypothetical protein